MPSDASSNRPPLPPTRFSAATRALLAATTLLVAAPVSADTIVLPNVTGFVYGAQDALWSTEIRVTNTAETMKRLRVVDWIGVDGALRTLEIQPGETRIVSGWELIYGGTRGSVVSLDEDVYGAAVCEKDEGLLVQSTIQTYTFTPPGGGIGTESPCPSWLGGYEVGFSGISCNEGSGPVLTHDHGFFAAGRSISVPWLFSSPSFRRQNLVLLNPDPVPSIVEISITSSDGKVTRTNTVTVQARSFLQINQLFRQPEWQEFLQAGGEHQRLNPAARATIRATTRLYALGYVISWTNNTVTVSLPM